MEDSSVTRGELRFVIPTNPDGNPDQLLYPGGLLCKMFESQTGDWEMISSDGKSYRCHKEVLSEQVGHFRAIYAHPETRECIQKQIVVPPEVDMDGPAVEAFLRLVYCQDMEPMNSSLEITCAIIRAGHYYNLPCMVDAANEVLQSIIGVKFKEMGWLNLKVYWKLYQQVCLWEESHPSKKSIMKNLVAMIKESCKKNSGSSANGCGPLMSLVTALVEDQESPPPTASRQGRMESRDGDTDTIDHIGIQNILDQHLAAQARYHHDLMIPDFGFGAEEDFEEVD